MRGLSHVPLSLEPAVVGRFGGISYAMQCVAMRTVPFVSYLSSMRLHNPKRMVVVAKVVL